MVWLVCKMRLRHMCTFASENLMVKGIKNGMWNENVRRG